MCQDCLLCSSYLHKFLFSYFQTINNSQTILFKIRDLESRILNKIVFKKRKKERKKNPSLITRVLIVGAADPVGLSHTRTRALARAHTRAHTHARSAIQLVVILGEKQQQRCRLKAPRVERGSSITNGSGLGHSGCNYHIMRPSDSEL